MVSRGDAGPETVSLVEICAGHRCGPAAAEAIDRLRPVVAGSREGVMLRTGCPLAAAECHRAPSPQIRLRRCSTPHFRPRGPLVAVPAGSLTARVRRVRSWLAAHDPESA